MIFYIGSGKELLAGIVDKIEDDVPCAVKWAYTVTTVHAHALWEETQARGAYKYRLYIYWPQDPSYIIVCPD